MNGALERLIGAPCVTLAANQHSSAGHELSDCAAPSPDHAAGWEDPAQQDATCNQMIMNPVCRNPI
jgi:hypothetical protein